MGSAFGIAVLIFQFIKFRQKYVQLERAVSQKEFLPETLPKAEGGLEAEYEKLVERLYENIQNMENIYNEKELDMLEYYTLWVHQIKTPIASMYLKLQGEDSGHAGKSHAAGRSTANRTVCGNGALLSAP